LKYDETEEAKAAVVNKRVEVSLLFIKLKKLNRLDKIRIRSGRELLQKEKQKVDSNLLQYQNLLYEADHLKKEIQRCYQFKSQDEEIELIPEEEFYEKAPESISRPDVTKNDEHAKHIARLEWELQQRKELDTLRNELQKSIESINKEIVLKTDRLQSLAPKLQDLREAAKPLQEALEMPIEQSWELPKRARLLPQPLYLLFVNLSAYAEACDQQIQVAINGDEEDAKQVNEENRQNEGKMCLSNLF
jgi:THO complex subunit 5